MLRTSTLAVLVLAACAAAQDPPVLGWEPALVTNPAKLKGLKRWTVEARYPRGSTLEAAFSPDGKRFATYGADQVLRVWEVPSAKLLTAAPVYGTFHRMAWAPDGSAVALLVGPLYTGGRVLDDAHLVVLDGKTFRTRHVVPAPGATGFCWSPDSGRVALGGRDRLQVRDLAGGKLVWEDKTLPDPAPQVVPGLSPAWSPDGRRIAAVRGMSYVGNPTDHPGHWTPGVSDQVYFWDVEKRKRTQATIPGMATPRQIAWEPGNRYVAFWVRELNDDEAFEKPYLCLAYTDGPQMRKCKQLTDERPDRPHNTHRRGTPISWDRDGVRVFAGRRVLRPFDDKVERTTDVPLDHDDLPIASPDGKRIAVLQPFGAHYAVTETMKVAFYDAARGKPLPGLIDGFGMVYQAYRGPHNMDLIDFRSPDYGFYPWVGPGEFAFGGFVWDLSKAERARATVPGGRGLLPMPSSSGKYVARQISDGTVRVSTARKTLFDVNDPDCLGVVSVSWSADEKRLAIVFVRPNFVATLRVVSVPDGKTVAAWGPEGLTGADHVALSPDGTRAVVSGILELPPAVFTVGEKKPRELPKVGYVFGWSADGKRLYGIKGTLWHAVDADTGKVLDSAPAPARVLGRKPGSGGWSLVAAVSGLRFYNLQTRETAGTLLRLRARPQPAGAIVTGDGHVETFGPADGLLVYIAETEAGDMLALTPREFAARYGWVNRPGKVRLDLKEPKPGD